MVMLSLGLLLDLIPHAVDSLGNTHIQGPVLNRAQRFLQLLIPACPNYDTIPMLRS